MQPRPAQLPPRPATHVCRAGGVHVTATEWDAPATSHLWEWEPSALAVQGLVKNCNRESCFIKSRQFGLADAPHQLLFPIAESALAVELARANDTLSCASIGHPSKCQRRAAVQRLLDAIVHGGSWIRNDSAGEMFPKRWAPFEWSRRWNSSRDGGLFDGKRVVVIGPSPMRNLALHLPLMLSGVFDASQIPHHPFTMYGKCSTPLSERHSIYGRGYTTEFPCQQHRCDPVLGFGCHDCFCCCGCMTTAPMKCGSQSFNVQVPPDPIAGRAAAVSVEYAAFSEFLHTHSDEHAFASRFCAAGGAATPDIVVVQKGTHEAYFDAYTMLNGSNPLYNRSTHPRLSEHAHASRLRPLVRRYLALFDCLPATTSIIFLSTYHSYKAPWEGPLVAAASAMLNELKHEGVFARHRMLFLNARSLRVHEPREPNALARPCPPVAPLTGGADGCTDTTQGWQLSFCSNVGGPRSLDGNHYESHMQTLVWELIAHALSLMSDGGGLSQIAGAASDLDHGLSKIARSA